MRLIKTEHDAKGGYHGAPLIIITKRYWITSDGTIKVTITETR